MLTSFYSVKNLLLGALMSMILLSKAIAQAKQTINVNQVWAGYFNDRRKGEQDKEGILFQRKPL